MLVQAGTGTCIENQLAPPADAAYRSVRVPPRVSNAVPTDGVRSNTLRTPALSWSVYVRAGAWFGQPIVVVTVVAAAEVAVHA